MPDANGTLTPAEICEYLVELAKRIETGESMKLVLLVEAKGKAGVANYGHKNIGEMFLQMEDAIFQQRTAFLVPQLLALERAKVGG